MVLSQTGYCQRPCYNNELDLQSLELTIKLSNMAASTKPALFEFRIHNDGKTTSIVHTHPVPTFLCIPAGSQQSSKSFHEAFIDVISLITNQHHDECMSAITDPCAGCGNPTKDALKSPMSYLHLAEPMVIVQVTPVCGSRQCEVKIRTQLVEIQKRVMGEGDEHEKKIYGKMGCEVCGKEDAKRCAGCGTVAYCGKECQKVGWKEHKRSCHRRKLAPPAEKVELPYEVI